MPLEFGLDQTAVVYTEHATTGAFTVVVTSGLKCRLALLGGDAAPTGGDRAELASRRKLLWDAAYTTMPETAQVDVDGQRWNIEAYTIAKEYMGVGAARTLWCHRAEVVRAV